MNIQLYQLSKKTMGFAGCQGFDPLHPITKCCHITDPTNQPFPSLRTCSTMFNVLELRSLPVICELPLNSPVPGSTVSYRDESKPLVSQQHNLAGIYGCSSMFTYWCVLRWEWMGCWGLLGWLLLVIMDHSRKFPTFSTCMFIPNQR